MPTMRYQRQTSPNPLLIAIRAMALFAFFILAKATGAAERPTPRLPSLDGDFATQGEYAGALEVAQGRKCWTGLQVVARGNGRFEAVEYSGGLPGNGGAKPSGRRYAGSRSSDRLELEGDNRRVSIEGNDAVVHDGSGRLLGRMRKFHRLSRTLGALPPPGARVLFDGSGVGSFSHGTLTSDRLLTVGADTRDSFGDFTLHAEFRTPYMPNAQGQARGNSGVYIQGRYEVQILDSFGLEVRNNECGALYKTSPPLLNMCFPPMSWQTYEIEFIAARFDPRGKKISPARITVWQNGIVIHKDLEIPNKTGAGEVEGPDPRPIRFQNHGDAVNFRNIWIVDARCETFECPACEQVFDTGVAPLWPASNCSSATRCP